MAMNENGSRTATQNRADTFGRTTQQAPTQELARQTESDRASLARVVESVVVRGDISGLTHAEKHAFYLQLCERLRLDPSTQPLIPLKLNNKEIFYVSRGATDQLASVWGVDRDLIELPNVYDTGAGKVIRATCRATWRGRVDTSTGAVPVPNGGGEPLCNALLKCESKAKRRATLSVLGLGMMDEAEIESIPATAKAPSSGGARSKQGGVEIEGEATEATPLDHLREALKSTKTVETIRAAWAKHSNAISEQGTSALKTARDEVFALHNSLGFAKTRKESDALLGKGEAPKAPAAPPAANDEAPRDWRVDDLSEDEGDHDTARALKSALCDAADGAAVVARWREAGPSVKTLPERDAKICYDAVVARWAQLMGTLDAAAADRAFREALKSPPDDSPKGTRKAAPKPAADAQGSASEVAAGTGTQARAALPESEVYALDPKAWAAHCVGYENNYEAVRSYVRHVPSFRLHGVLDERRATSVAWLQANCGIDDPEIAQRVLDNAESAADAKPRVPSIGERNRRARDAKERAGMGDVARAYAKAS